MHISAPERLTVSLRGRRRGERAVAGLLLTLLVTAACIGVTAAPARAHSDLVSSYPAAGERLDEPPQQITLEFATAVAMDEDGLVVRGPDGRELGAEVLGSATGSVFLAVVEPGAPSGRWTVSYDGLSVDGHRVSGEFGFSAGASTGMGVVREAKPGRTTAGAAVLLSALAAGFLVMASLLVRPGEARP